VPENRARFREAAAQSSQPRSRAETSDGIPRWTIYVTIGLSGATRRRARWCGPACRLLLGA